MKRKLSIVLTIVMALTVLSVAPASAKAPLTGYMDLEFNLGFMNESTACPHITWTGTVTLDGELYAITYEPLGLPKEVGAAFHFEEIWRIHDLEDVATAGGVATTCGGEGLIWSTDKGVVTAPNGKGHANGTIQGVDSAGPFDESLIGNKGHWSGSYTNEGLGFAGPFRINR